MAKSTSFALRCMLGLIWVYQRIVSPWLKPRCRFMPTCSEYTKQALCQHGCVRGCVLGMMRLLRCHPWGGSGYDPVPKAKRGKSL